MRLWRDSPFNLNITVVPEELRTSLKTSNNLGTLTIAMFDSSEIQTCRLAKLACILVFMYNL